MVTSFTFPTAPAPPAVSFFLQFGFTAATDVLGAWQNWILTRPDELTAGCTINSPDRCVVSGLFLGGETALSGHLDDLIRQVGVQSTAREVTQPAWPRRCSASPGVAGCLLLSAVRTGRLGAKASWQETFTATSRVLYRPTDPAAVIEAIDAENVAVLLDPIGGAAGRVAADATAFPHRNALATIQLYSGRHKSPHGQRAARPPRRLVGQWGYVNYIDPMMPRWAHAYYAANLPRLRGTARKVRPRPRARLRANVV